MMPRGGPFWGPLPTPFDESAVPNELVPGAAGLVPKAGGDGHPPGTDAWVVGQFDCGIRTDWKTGESRRILKTQKIPALDGGVFEPGFSALDP